MGKAIKKASKSGKVLTEEDVKRMQTERLALRLGRYPCIPILVTKPRDEYPEVIEVTDPKPPPAG